jgi:hypothetical protein
VVLIGETAAGPAKVGNFDGPKSGDNIVTDTPCIRDRGFFPNPKPAVDTTAQMLGKMTVYVTVDPHIALPGVNHQSVHDFFLRYVLVYIDILS